MKTRALITALAIFGSLGANVFDPEQTYFDEEYNYEHGKDYAVPPPQYPAEQGAMIVFLDLSYTFWKPYQQGMFLLYSRQVTDGTPKNWVNTTVSPRSGFKIGLGFNTFHDGWRANANYTWFYNKRGYQTPSLAPSISYYSLWSDISDGTVGILKYEWNNIFQRIDITVDRTFYIGNYLTFKPWAGIIGAWDDQTFNQIVTPQTGAQYVQTIKQTMDWYGAGPYGGFESSYYMIDELAIDFFTGGSINFAAHKTKILNTRAAVSTPVMSNTKTHLFDIEPMLETYLGLKWDTYGKDWALSLKAGWELQVWFSHNSFIQAYDTSNYQWYNNFGHYTMQGLTVNGCVNF